MRLLITGSLTLWGVLTLGTAAAQTTNAPPNEWAQFRGTPGLSGTSDASVPETLELLWTFEAGESIDSSAAIVDGVVYVGTYSGELVAVDLETGTERWRYLASEDMGTTFPPGRAISES